MVGSTNIERHAIMCRLMQCVMAGHFAEPSCSSFYRHQQTLEVMTTAKVAHFALKLVISRRMATIPME